MGAATLTIGLLWGPLLTASAPSEEAALAASVSELRVRIDGLAEELEAERRRARDALSALRLERAELQRQLRLEQIRHRTFDRLDQERARRTEALEARTDAVSEPLAQALDIARSHLQQTLPFARAARTQQLDALQERLFELQPGVADVFARLWRFVEEEAALTKEAGVSEQTVFLGEERRLVEVARLSMALLYLRSSDGRVGWARKRPGGWRLEWVDEGSLIARAIEAIFEAFKGNRTFGPLRLPLPIAPGALKP